MTRRPPPKSRVRAEKVRVIVHPSPSQGEQQQNDADPPGYSGHNGGSFGDSGYRSGRGLFGFRQEVVQ